MRTLVQYYRVMFVDNKIINKMYTFFVETSNLQHSAGNSTINTSMKSLDVVDLEYSVEVGMFHLH